jgi:hypothetical protein
MKSKTTAVEKPISAVDQMLKKREGLMSERDVALARLMELNSGIESLDSVISMFDPNHVPLDIRRAAQNAPLLTLQAQPILADVAAKFETAASDTKATSTPVKGKASPSQANSKSKVQTGKPAEKPEKAVSNTVTDQAKQKARQQDKKKKKMAAARELIKEYFGDIDKLKTLEDIVKSSATGVPFKEICEKFAERHPIDISKPETKKVFSDRISNILYGLSQQSVVQRGERAGDSGNKENVWLYTRVSKKVTDGREAAEAEASEAV